MANGSDVSTRLLEMCRSHDIDERKILSCGDIGGVVDHVLTDLGRKLDAIASDTEGAQLHNLVNFLRDASTLKDTEPVRARLDARFDNLAMFCHKINNPLTTLLGRSQILQLKAGQDPNIGKAVNVIQESAQRIAGLVREMSQEVCDARDELGSETAERQHQRQD